MLLDSMFDIKNIIDFSLLFVIYRGFFYKRWKKDNETFILRTIFYIYISGILWVTLMPVILNLRCVHAPYVPMHMVPFEDLIMHRQNALLQIILNIIMMIPMGYFLPKIYKTKGFTTILIVFLVSLSIETLQPLLTSVRTADITDLITNTFGGLMGYLVYIKKAPK